MSQTQDHERRKAEDDAIREEFIAVVRIYYSNMHEAVGIDRAGALTIERIARKNGWHISGLGERIAPEWHFKDIPKLKTVIRRGNEAAQAKFYPCVCAHGFNNHIPYPENTELRGSCAECTCVKFHSEPPLVCIGMRKYLGKLESQYMPRLEG